MHAGFEHALNYYLGRLVSEWNSLAVIRQIRHLPGDLAARILFTVLAAGIFLVLQNFQAGIRKLMRSLLDSYRYSGLIAFKAVWDEIENKNERGKLRQYIIISLAAGTAAAFSLFPRMNIMTAVISGPPAALFTFLIELHLILRWFYSSKPFPVLANAGLKIAALISFILFMAMSVVAVGNLYYSLLKTVPYIKYAAWLVIAAMAVAMPVFSGRLIRKDKSGPFLRRVDVKNLAAFYIAPACLAFLASCRELFAGMTRPVNGCLHKLFYLPEVLMPLLMMISVMVLNASGSYLGFRIRGETARLKYGRDENIDTDANPFTGVE